MALDLLVISYLSAQYPLGIPFIQKTTPMAQDAIQQLDRFKNTFNQVVQSSFSFANPGVLLQTAFSFGTELLFRFIRLGRMIRQKVEEQTGKLDVAVRAEGIFRSPLTIDLTATELINFFHGECRLLYPRVPAQFAEELSILANLDDPRWPETFRFLRIARKYIHHYMDNKQLDEEPELQELIGAWQDPAGVKYRELVLQIAQLLPADALSLEDWRNLLPDYTRMMLQTERYKILSISTAQLAELNEQIRELSWQQVTGGNNSTLNLTLNFLVEERTLVINREVESLTERLKVLAAPPVDPAKQAEINQLRTRVQDLNQFKQRISGLLK